MTVALALSTAFWIALFMDGPLFAVLTECLCILALAFGSVSNDVREDMEA